MSRPQIWDAIIGIVKAIQGMLVSVLELMGILRTSEDGSGNGDNGGNGNGEDPPDPPEEEFRFDIALRNNPEHLWPDKVMYDGIMVRVRYLQVTPNAGKDKVLLRRELGRNDPTEEYLLGAIVPTISDLDGLQPGQAGPSTDRVGAKNGDIIMVLESPGELPREGYDGIYRYVPFSDFCRPFACDGGRLAFLVMPRQAIGGVWLNNIPGDRGYHPHLPLYLMFAISGEQVVNIYLPQRS